MGGRATGSDIGGNQGRRRGKEKMRQWEEPPVRRKPAYHLRKLAHWLVSHVNEGGASLGAGVESGNQLFSPCLSWLSSSGQLARIRQMRQLNVSETLFWLGDKGEKGRGCEEQAISKNYARKASG